MLTAVFVLLVLVAAVVAVALIVGAKSLDAETRALRARLEAARVPVRPPTVDFRELPDLPDPVQRYFRTVLTDGQPMIAGVRVTHAGTFNMGEVTDRWKRFTSEQMIVGQRPGFDWNGRIAMMPGVTVHVHDAYVAGAGILHASLFGLFTVADVRGTGDVAEGELMRFLAEAAWYPTALLPSQGVRWEPVDDRSARATLTDGSLSVTMLFAFDESGLVETVRAEARGRIVSGEITRAPWEGRFWNYAERDGMRVPLEGEVAWLLADGPKPYWRGRIMRIRYAFSQ
ncbi:MAG TPA: DUF6544 family protein [Longimicrobiales bacterium]|nr:DUF6544 family protein [Longimicrobiales bacterium]